MAENKKSNNKKGVNNKTNSTNNKTVANKKQNNSKKVTEEKKSEKTVSKKEEIIVKETKTAKASEPKSSNNKNKRFKLSDGQKDLALIALVVVVLIVALFVTSSKVEKVNIELPVALEGTAGFSEITYSDYEEKLNSGKPFLVVIVRDGCGYCEEYEPVVKETTEEYKVPAYYINLSNITEEEFNKLSKSNSYLKREKWGTPTTLLLQGNTVIDSIGGYVEKEKLVAFIEENIKVDSDVQ